MTDPTGMFGVGGMVASIGIALGNVATEVTTGALILGTLEYAGRPAFNLRASGLMLIAQGNVSQGFELYNLGSRIAASVFAALETIDAAIGAAGLGVVLALAAVKLARIAPGLAEGVSSFASGLIRQSKSKVYGNAFVVGRRNGVVVSPTALSQTAPYGVLDNYPGTFTRLKVGQDARLDGLSTPTSTVNGEFRVLPNGEMEINLRTNPTYYELLHEMQHYEHAVELGPRNWASNRNAPGGELWAEQAAYNRLKKSDHWQHFTPEEIADAQNYIMTLGGYI